MIVVHAAVPVDPDSRDEAVALIRELAEHSRAEEGVIDYRAAADVDDENLIRIFEQYEDEAALGAHGESDHYQEFQASIADLLGGVPEATRYDVESAAELDL